MFDITNWFCVATIYESVLKMLFFVVVFLPVISDSFSKEKSLQFLVSAHVASDPCVSIFSFLFCCCYETMSNCSQNCWIDWNSAVLCFKRPFNRGMSVCPICEAFSKPPYFVYGKYSLVPITTYMYFTGWQKKKITPQKNASLHWFWSRPLTRNQRHFLILFFAKSKNCYFPCWKEGPNSIYW